MVPQNKIWDKPISSYGRCVLEHLERTAQRVNVAIPQQSIVGIVLLELAILQFPSKKALTGVVDRFFDGWYRAASAGRDVSDGRYIQYYVRPLLNGKRAIIEQARRMTIAEIPPSFYDIYPIVSTGLFTMDFTNGDLESIFKMAQEGISTKSVEQAVRHTLDQGVSSAAYALQVARSFEQQAQYRERKAGKEMAIIDQKVIDPSKFRHGPIETPTNPDDIWETARIIEEIRANEDYGI